MQLYRNNIYIAACVWSKVHCVLVVLLPVGQAQLFDTVFTAGLLQLALNANEALFSDATSGSMF